MNTLSFDLSLNSTGVILPDGAGLVVKGLDHKHADQARHKYLFEQFCELMEEHKPEAIYKEAIFVHKQRMNGSIQLLQVHGLLTAAVVMYGNPTIYDVGPTQLKAWVTEQAFGEKEGRADKDRMYEAAVILGYDLENQNDIVDAWCVRKFFEAHIQ